VTVGGVTYKGNVFAENVSVPGGVADTVNNMESVFLNPTNMAQRKSGGDIRRPVASCRAASNIAGTGVPNVAGPLNQDFALVVYQRRHEPPCRMSRSCIWPRTTPVRRPSPSRISHSRSQNILQIRRTPTYNQAPVWLAGGLDEFFKLPLPAAGTIFTIDTFGSDFDTVLSVWSVQEVPQTISSAAIAER